MTYCEECGANIMKDYCKEDCECQECREEREAKEDREFDEQCALGYR